MAGQHIDVNINIGRGGTGGNGAAGGNGLNSGDGGGGGGGGIHGLTTGSLNNSATLTPIIGGAGYGGGTGYSSSDQAIQGGGGGGGAGGYGVVVTGNGTSTNIGTIQGGLGGKGGGAGGTPGYPAAQSGSGGDGGIGVYFAATNAVFNNGGQIYGGSGGSAGALSGTATAGSAGQGGAGVVGASLSIINSGAIAGGMSADGVTRANAITFTAGTNKLTLLPGSTITGGVVDATSMGTLALGSTATGNASFDVSQIGFGAQYQGFSTFAMVGSNTWSLTNTTTALTPWTVSSGTLSISSDANLGAAAGGVTLAGGTLQATSTMITGRSLTLNAGTTSTLAATNGTTLTWNGSIGGDGALILAGQGEIWLYGVNSYTGGTIVQTGVRGDSASLQGDIVNNSNVVFSQNSNGIYAGSMSGTGNFILSGSGTLTVTGASTYQGYTDIAAGTLRAAGANNILSANSAFTISPGATLDLGGTTQTIASLSGAGTVTNSGTSPAKLAVGGNNQSTAFSGTLQDGTGTLGLVKTGSGTLQLGGTSSYSGETRIEGGVLRVAGGTLSANSAFAVGRSGVLDLGGTAQTIGSLSGSGTVTSTGAGVATLTTNGNNATTVFNGNLQDGTNGSRLSLVKMGNGTLNLTGSRNTYSGGTTVSAGILQGNSTSLQGSIVNNSLVVFHQDFQGGTYAGSISGSGALHVRGGGQIILAGNNSFTGPTTVFGTTLVVNGSLTSAVTLNSGSTLGGNGVIGTLTSNASILAPGNSIGTLTVSGGLTQNGGTYQLDVGGRGQTDRINITGAAMLNGGVVQVQAAQDSYASSTTYTILNATGGLSGTFAGTTDNLAFLTPTLSYDANNAYLTLSLQGAAFSGGGTTPNQQGAGTALDQSYATATGDLAVVIGALAGSTVAQGSAALEVLGGHAWADMGTMNIAGTTMFMNGVGQQMALARAGGGGGQRLALAQSCDIAMCDASSPFSVWGGVLGGTGSVSGDGNAGGVTYTQGGAAAGIDYRIDPRLLVGLGVGYSSGSLWVNNVQGKGWNNAVTAAAYASFTQGGFYADVLAGYGWATNQLQRQIALPNLASRTASGSTGANQYFGQAEIGYQVSVYAPAQASITPFARLQAINVTQGAFSEWGANSISLNVAQQSTNALRSTLGAQLNGGIPMGDSSLALALRLGWQHEFDYTKRPMTAAFAGAPSASFTVYGAPVARDAAIVGLQADTRLADSLQLYLRYDGEFATGNDNHALTAGLRFSW